MSGLRCAVYQALLLHVACGIGWARSSALAVDTTMYFPLPVRLGSKPRYI